MCALYVRCPLSALQKECRKVWGARYTLGVRYRSENTVIYSPGYFKLILMEENALLCDRMTVHRNRFLVNKTNRRTEFQLYWYYDSAYFGQPFCSSSGVPSRTSAVVHFVQL